MKTNVSLSFRFVLVGIAFTIPFAVLIRSMIVEKDKAIDFAKLEIVGTDHMRPLASLMAHLSMHRVLYQSSLQGLVLDQDPTVEVTQAIEKDIGELEKAYTANREALQFRGEDLAKRNRSGLTMQNLTDLWAQIIGSMGHKNADMLGTYQAMLDIIKGMITHTGDTSNLVLDPDLDSYYLMDVVMFAFPGLIERFQETSLSLFRASVKVGLGLQALPDVEKMIESRVLVSQLESDFARIKGSTETAINEDAHFFGKNTVLQNDVPSETRSLQGRVTDYSQLAKTVIGKEIHPGIVKSTVENLENGLKIWQKDLETLNALLTARIDQFVGERNYSVVWIVISWLFAWVLAFFLQRAIASPIQRILMQLGDISKETKLSSTQLHHTSQLSAKAVTGESAAIQQSVSAMAEITSMLSQTADHTHAASEAAQAILNQTQSGTQTMEQMASSMTGIAESNARLKEITKIIEDITNQTNVINDIVFKTQLLAVNASIEAARAGHHGKGFAVVANEVANLASTSGKAASEIRSLLNESRSQVASILESTTESVQNGQDVSSQAILTFNEISRSVSDIVDKIRQIHEATKEQEIGVKQTSDAMNHLSMSTHKNNTLSKENASLSEVLKFQAERIERVALAMNYVVMGSDNIADLSKKSRSSKLDMILTEDSESSPSGGHSSHDDSDAAPAPRARKKAGGGNKADLVQKIIGNLTQKGMGSKKEDGGSDDSDHNNFTKSA
jgi:methyl-accepting chemotaxis protein